VRKMNEIENYLFKVWKKMVKGRRIRMGEKNE